MNNDKALIKQEKPEVLQMLPVEQMTQWYQDFVKLAKSILKEKLDFGMIPGTSKNTLYKAGAEKLRLAFSLGTKMKMTGEIFDIEKPYIDYTYRCTVSTKTGQVLAQCDGSCNSYETKYRYSWRELTPIPPKDVTNLQKAEGTGKFRTFDDGKTWHYYIREDNKDVLDKKNTIQKMAQKRAFVGAILMSTGASEFFTQDLEDLPINGNGSGDKKDAPASPKQGKTTSKASKSDKEETIPMEQGVNLIQRTADKIDDNQKQAKDDATGNPDKYIELMDRINGFKTADDFNIKGDKITREAKDAGCSQQQMNDLFSHGNEIFKQRYAEEREDEKQPL